MTATHIGIVISNAIYWEYTPTKWSMTVETQMQEIGLRMDNSAIHYTNLKWLNDRWATIKSNQVVPYDVYNVLKGNLLQPRSICSFKPSTPVIAMIPVPFDFELFDLKCQHYKPTQLIATVNSALRFSETTIASMISAPFSAKPSSDFFIVLLN